MNLPIATNAFRGTAQYKFDNGYGASVIPDPHRPLLFEVAVLGPDGDIAYGVLGLNGTAGFLTSADVEALLDRIAALEPATVPTIDA